MPTKNQYTDTCRKAFQRFFGKPIEEYDSIKRACGSLSVTSQKNYYRNLPNYFLYLKEDPDTVIKNRRKHISQDNPDTLEYYEAKTKEYIKLLKEKGLAGRGINGIIGRIGGFYKNNSKRYSLDLGPQRISKARKRQKYSPSNMEVRELLSWCDCVRDRLILTVAYHCGAAPIDISLLCCGDLPTEPFKYFEKTRSKTGEVWRGVSTPDLASELTAYLKIRGNPPATELLFKSREGYLDNEGVSGVISNLIKKSSLASIPGIKPTSLRDAFEDALVDGNVKRKVKEALMAHNSDIETQYGGYNQMVDRLVAAMKNTYPLLCLNDVNRNVAGFAGLTLDDVETVKQIAKDKDLYRELAFLVKEKKLYHIDDPTLIERLRKEGKI